MSVINSIPLIAAGDDGYRISRSVRLRSSASAYFNRTLTTPTNNLKWTWSAWIKRGTLTTSNPLFYGGDGSSNNFAGITFRADDTLQFAQINGGTYNVQVYTTAVFRDPSAWYHVVVVYDSANATSTDRIQLYVNGVRYTSLTYATGPFAQNTASKINSALGHYLGKIDYAAVYPDCYVTENNFVDGQALTPSSFGETNTTTGVWQPKKYAGTYGTNGFYLNFSDNSAATAAAIGKDSSGNGNNWTPNNISVTAGTTYDSMLDTPTPYADGGNGRGNYAVMNPLDVLSSASNRTMSNGNLTLSLSGTWNGGATIGVTSGKFYCEYVLSANIDSYIGIDNGSAVVATAYRKDGTRYNGSSFVAYGATYTTGDVIGMAFDATNSTIEYFKNGTSQGQITGVSYGSLLRPFFYGLTSAAFDVNFGQRPFSYTPPTGFKALNTQNLPDATIKKGNQYFDATTYTGNGSTQSIVNAGGFQPDLVWAKTRVVASSNALFDSVRGATKVLVSNSTVAETNLATNGVTAFNSNGFSVTDDSAGDYYVNGASGGTYSGTPPNYVAWQWKAAGSSVSNTSGTITSTVNAGTSQGFSVVTYTTTTGTVGHGLGVAPSMIIMKARNNTDQWTVGHKSLNGGSSPWNYGIPLNTTAATQTNGGFWNNTAPTSSVFSVGSWSSGFNMVAYCFAEVAGYSKFGSYTGNGSADGPFVYLGFRPKYVLLKNANNAGANWIIEDSSRDTYNATGLDLYPNVSDAEGNNTPQLDFLSNGFKLRATTAGKNGSGNTIIYAAFAENPFKNSLAR